VRQVRRKLKKRDRRINRILIRRKFRHTGVDEQVRRMMQQMDRAWERNWEDCKRLAIEAAAGIT
jgi:hypothetical protein